MKSTNVISVLLAAALLLLAIKIVFMEKKDVPTTAPEEQVSSEDAVIQNIMTRVSVREYTSQAPSDQQIETLLRAGFAAPSAGNRQPWRIVVVKDQAVKDKLTEGHSAAQPAKRAPVVFVICGEPAASIPGINDYWIQDCSAVSENMLLAAHGMGLGGVWIGVYPVPENVARVSSVMGLPEGTLPLGMLAIGYPAENPAPKNKWKPANIHYEKW